MPTLTELAGPNTVIVAPQAVFGMMPPALQAKTKVMANGQTQTHAGVSVEAVPEYNITQERLQFHPKGRDNGYVLNLRRPARLYRWRHRRHAGAARAHEHRHRVRADEPALYDGAPTRPASAVAEFKPRVVYGGYAAGRDTSPPIDTGEERRPQGLAPLLAPTQVGGEAARARPEPVRGLLALHPRRHELSRRSSAEKAKLWRSSRTSWTS